RGYWRSTNPMASGIGRNVRAPQCLPYYANEVDTTLRPDIPGIWDSRCFPSGSGAGYSHKGQILSLRTVSANIPVDFAFPDQVQSASLTLVLGNAWEHNHSLFGNYQGSTERLPAT